MIHPPVGSLVRKSLCAFALSLCAAGSLLADADQDWKAITALDAGPAPGHADTRQEALGMVLKHFDQVEAALRAFIAKYPNDAHNIDARLRLSHLYVLRSDVQQKASYYTAANKILDDLEADKSTPDGRRADISFARITMIMHEYPKPDARMRETLTAYVTKFQQDFPGDRRSGVLLAEVASLYDADPERKKELLNAALRYADNDDGLRKQINDDFKRLGMLGQPLELKFDSLDGAPIDIQTYKGKVVLVYFFASWSPPSAAALAEVKQIAGAFPPANFQLLAISLDQKKEALDALFKKIGGLNCPLYFDGKGWESPLARSLGVNALPTAWVVDRKGILRTLNATDNTEGVIRSLIREE